MNKICEMLVTNYFKLSTGHIALAGTMNPDLDELLSRCKAYLYIGNKKVRSINIVGEDKFNRVNEEVRQNRRSVRTTDDIYEELSSAGNKQVHLVFYSDAEKEI